MTPAQQSALEALVGRSLTLQEVSQIDTFISAGAINAIASLLSAGRVTYAATRKVEIGLIGTYPDGPVAADALLTKLEDYAAAAQPVSKLVSRALRALQAEPGLDIGDPATRAMLAALVAGGVLTAGESSALTSIALVPDPVSEAQVQAALEV